MGNASCYEVKDAARRERSLGRASPCGEVVVRSNASRTVVGKLGMLKWLVLPAVLCILAYTSVSALWLPWASEQDKVTKVLNEIWQALVDNDRKMLKDYVTGTGSELFIAQEEALIKRMKIKKYDCRPKRITIDQGTGSWAFVDLEKVAKLENGETFTRRDMTVLKKFDGLWRLLIEPKKSRRSKEKSSKLPAEESRASSAQDGAPAGPSVNSPSASKPATGQ